MGYLAVLYLCSICVKAYYGFNLNMVYFGNLVLIFTNDFAVFVVIFVVSLVYCTTLLYYLAILSFKTASMSPPEYCWKLPSLILFLDPTVNTLTLMSNFNRNPNRDRRPHWWLGRNAASVGWQHCLWDCVTTSSPFGCQQSTDIFATAASHVLWWSGVRCRRSVDVQLTAETFTALPFCPFYQNRVLLYAAHSKLSMGPFCVTRSNPTHQLTDPT